MGNILEDLLGISENNLAIANSGEWEIKAKRKATSSLTTLLHNEPSPRKASLVSQLLLPFYGWPHKNAGKKYPEDEKSFRQTIRYGLYSDRGFSVLLDDEEEKIFIDFDASKVDEKHFEWLKTVEQRIGLGKLEPAPYWGFRDLAVNLGSKLINCFFILADTKKEGGKEYFWYKDITMLSQFSVAKFLSTLQEGLIYIDFDARTGHNHGTKFRVNSSYLHKLYEDEVQI